MRLPPNEDPHKHKRPGGSASGDARLPPRPQSLDELLAHAETSAGQTLRDHQQLAPTCLLLTPEGIIPVVAGSFDDDRAKDQFLLAVRLAGVAEGAFAVVLMLESWFLRDEPGHPVDPTITPAESINRREAVLLIGESRDAQKQIVLPIIRTDAGGFFGFGEPISLNSPTGHRYQKLLTPTPPDARQRELARAILKAAGHRRGGQTSGGDKKRR